MSPGRSNDVDATLFGALGAWVSRTHLADIPQQAQDVAKQAILDCVGCTAAGLVSPVGEILTRYLTSQPGVGEAGVSTLVGRLVAAPAELAAFANGAQGHALDYDDCTASLGGHPSVVILPAVLAVAEEVGATGAQVLAAYALGFEVAAKMGRALNFVHYERGWHPTATLAVFGAAAAVAKLMDHDARQTATTLSMAASAASGVKANFGTATKPLQVGMAAQKAVQCARLVGAGADANLGAFEHEHGFGNVYNGEGQFEAEEIPGMLGKSWDLIDPGLIIKRYPCCASTHGAIDAVLACRRQLNVEEIERVEVWTHPRRLKHTNRPVVATGVEAKFSLQYAAARALLSGTVGLSDFDSGRIAETDVSDLMRRVEASPMPAERWGADHFPAEVRVSNADGTSVSARVERPRGNGPNDALTTAELRSKFNDCMAFGGFASPVYTAVGDAVLSLETVGAVTDLTQLLRSNRDAELPIT